MTLSLEFDWIRAFRLSDGRLTRGRQVAEQDRKCRITQRQDDVSTAMAALLRVPVAIDNCRPTPARVEFIRDLVAAGVLPVAVHGQVESLTVINDATWEPLSRLRDLIHPEEVEHHCWTLTLLDDFGRCLDVPGGFDPLAHTDDAPPVRALHAALNVLALNGWQVTSADTEHYPPDDDGPDWLDLLDDSSLRAIRYSLVRTRLLATESIRRAA